MLGRHLVGVAGEAVSIASYLPSVTTVPARGVKLFIRGNYPFDSRAALTFDMPKPAAFPVDFALPFGVSSLRVEVDGKLQKVSVLPSGFHRIQRTWKPRENVNVIFDFPLQAHFHSESSGKRWVSFTRGPVVLAAESPHELTGDSKSSDARTWVEGSDTTYRIKGGPVLMPYSRAGVTKGGVYMYFAIRR